MTRKHAHRCRRRPSFTLIEILVVIAIITALMALTIGAVFRFLQTQAQKNTDATITKIDRELQSQWEEVIRAASKEEPCSTAVTLANGDTNVARTIHIKMRLRQEFPMSFYEALNQDPSLKPIRDYIDKLTLAGVANNPMNSSQDENSACLLLALERKRGGKGVNLDDLLNSAERGTMQTQQIGAGPTSTRVPLKQPLPFVKDYWGQPIVLYRWPTSNAELDSLSPTTKSAALRDIQDPEGHLQQSTWWNSPQRLTFEANFHPVSKNGAPYAYYTVPVIASGGPNKKLGTAPYPPTPPYPLPPFANNSFANAPSSAPDPMLLYPGPNNDFADSNDNIYSYRLRLGGSGN